jgi:hypothetical protein
MCLLLLTVTVMDEHSACGLLNAVSAAFSNFAAKALQSPFDLRVAVIFNCQYFGASDDYIGLQVLRLTF